jgi:hypothetical protein
MRRKLRRADDPLLHLASTGRRPPWRRFTAGSAGSFKSYGARAVITDGRGSTVTVPLFNNRNLSYWVAIALIDFTVPSGAQIRHVEKYSGNHVEARPTLYSSGNFRMSTGKVEFKTR